MRAERRHPLAAAGLEALWLLAAAAFPVALWHRVLADELAAFHFTLAYVVSELGPWCLVAAGLLFLVPVAASAGLHPESRAYPRARRSWATWGIVLYLLGLILLVEVDQLWRFSH